MLQVDFYIATDDDQDKPVGTIRWTGDKFVLMPKESQRLKSILETAALPLGGSKEVSSDESPEEWLKALRWQYKSYALRASEAYEPKDTDMSQSVKLLAKDFLAKR